MIGVLGDQHLRDQRLDRNATLDDPRRCRGLHHCTLTSTTAIARPAGDQDAKAGRHHIKTFGNVLTDLMERPAAAWASLVLDIDNLLDPLEMRRQRATVGLAWSVGPGLAGCRVACRTSLAKRRLDIFKANLQLIRVKLLGTCTEPVAHEGIDNRLQPLDLGVCVALGRRNFGELAGLLKGERTQRFNVFGKVRFHEHGRSESAGESPVNRQFAGRSGAAHHAPGASPALRLARPIALPSAASRRPEC